MLFLTLLKKIPQYNSHVIRHFTTPEEVNVHRSLHRESMSIIVQQDPTMHIELYLCRLLYM